MLNISKNSIKDRFPQESFTSFGKSDLPAANRMFRNWLIGTFAFLFTFLFLPWTQNIQSEGKLTTLDPEHRPQTIHSTIAGRIEKWYVREGDFVSAGDTIVYLSEIKTDYFDPQLVDRTQGQVRAKEGSISSYQQKVSALEEQVRTLRAELIFKREQLENKLTQARLKLESRKADYEQAKVDFQIADFQYRRTDTLYQKGIKSLTDLENKNMKRQETRAKLTGAENSLKEAENEVRIAEVDLNSIENSYQNKIAKAESEKFSTMSLMYDADAQANKLRTTYESYRQRATFYYVVAPQNSYINVALKPGIGETVKEGDPIVSIMPTEYDMAVELYIKPMDLPLIQIGEEVRFIFDGWPAFVFSGWPDMSFGTYSGSVVAIENNISPNGKYRVLVSQTGEKKWPKALRIGSGAKGIALLNRVPVYYELWRRLNGFPANFYEGETSAKDSEGEFKAPVKSLK